MDNAERKSIETALRESEAQFRQVTEHIQEVFWLSDTLKNEVLYISPAYQAIWGRSCESLYRSPRSWLEAIHPDDRERVLEAALTKRFAQELGVRRAARAVDTLDHHENTGETPLDWLYFAHRASGGAVTGAASSPSTRLSMRRVVPQKAASAIRARSPT